KAETVEGFRQMVSIWRARSTTTPKTKRRPASRAPLSCPFREGSERAFCVQEGLGIILSDQGRVEDVAASDLDATGKVRGGQLDGGGDHRRAVAHVDRRQRIAIGNGLDDLLHAGAADHKHFTFAASLLDGFDGADGDVVVLGPNGLDVREAG